MIITKVVGGLGNQMFQYAMVRAASIKFDTEFKLDVSSYKRHSSHNGYELDKIFDIPADIASKQDIINLICDKKKNKLAKYLPFDLALRIFKRNVCNEVGFGFIPDLKITNKYLIGYWQSYKYFEAFKPTIMNDFRFNQDLSGKNSKIVEKIMATNSVSLHIRRGDYTTKNNLKVHGVCTADYYKNAIAHINKTVQNPTFFIFSDDLDWVKKNIHITDNKYYVDGNVKENSWIDMYLMSICKNNIIANSTFSWWGAYLNKSNNIIVAPKNWFDREYSIINGISLEDLIPSNWILLD